MFVIVRHGNTFATGETARRIGARTDLPLTEKGVLQGQALGIHFAAFGWRFARVLVSPLLRTRESANAILQHLPGSPLPEVSLWLREIDHGPDEGRTEAEVLARIGPDALAAWDAHAVPPPGWVVDAEERISAWHALFEKDEGPTLLVTSNGAARFALLAAGLEATGDETGSLKLATGSYGVLRRLADGTLAVDDWGRRP